MATPATAALSGTPASIIDSDPPQTEAIDDDLRNISARIAEMGGLAEEQLSQSIEAMTLRDSDLAAEIIRADKRLDGMEMQLEKAAIEFMALTDLETVMWAAPLAGAPPFLGDPFVVRTGPMVKAASAPARARGSTTP